MTTDLETRLRNYGDVLDRAAAVEPTMTARTRRWRPLVVATAMATAAVAVLGVLATRPSRQHVRVVPGDGVQGAEFLLARDGWTIARADESSTETSPTLVSATMYQDTAQGFNGPFFLVLGNRPQGADSSARVNDLVTAKTWASPAGVNASVVGVRMQDATLNRVVESLRVEGHTVTAGWIPDGFSEVSLQTLGEPAERQRHAEFDYVKDGHTIQLRLTTGTPADFVTLVDDRIRSASQIGGLTVAGTPGVSVRYEGSDSHSAMWYRSGVVYELAGDAGSPDQFFAAARAFQPVDRATLLRALPPSAVKPEQRDAMVNRMLAGIPAPPGFDAVALRSSGDISDVYQLGAQVAGAVACAWLDRYYTAIVHHDQGVAQDAVAQLHTAHQWRVLNDMNADGDYPEVLWDIADRLARGEPVSQEATSSALGCRVTTP